MQHSQSFHSFIWKRLLPKRFGYIYIFAYICTLCFCKLMANSLLVDHLKIRSNFLDCVANRLRRAQTLKPFCGYTLQRYWLHCHHSLLGLCGAPLRTWCSGHGFRIHVQWTTTTGRDCEFHLSLRSPQGWIRKRVKISKIEGFHEVLSFFCAGSPVSVFQNFSCLSTPFCSHACVSAICNKRHHIYDLTKLQPELLSFSYASQKIFFPWHTCILEMYPRSFHCQETYGSVWSPEGLLLLVACVNDCRSPFAVDVATCFDHPNVREGHAGRSKTRTRKPKLFTIDFKVVNKTWQVVYYVCSDGNSSHSGRLLWCGYPDEIRWAWCPASAKMDHLFLKSSLSSFWNASAWKVFSIASIECWFLCKSARDFLAFKRRVWISDSDCNSFQGSWLKVEQYVRAYLLYLLATFLARLPRLNFEICTFATSESAMQEDVAWWMDICLCMLVEPLSPSFCLPRSLQKILTPERYWCL